MKSKPEEMNRRTLLGACLKLKPEVIDAVRRFNLRSKSEWYPVSGALKKWSKLVGGFMTV